MNYTPFTLISNTVITLLVLSQEATHFNTVHKMDFIYMCSTKACLHQKHANIIAQLQKSEHTKQIL